MADPQKEFQEANQQQAADDDSFVDGFGEGVAPIFEEPSSGDNIAAEQRGFPDIEGQETGNQEPTDTDTEQKSDDGDPVPEGVDDPESWKHYQSKYHKTQQELEEKEARLNELEEVVPIADYIQRDPQMLDILERRLRGEDVVNPDTQRADRQSRDSLEKPTRPEKPDDYDHWEAVNDPDSKSAEYQKQLMSYQESLAEYNEQFTQQKEQEFEQQQQQLQQQQQQKQQLQQVARTLQSDYDMGENEVQDFIQTMSDPQSRSLDNLVKLYKINRGVSEEEIEKKKKAAQNRQRKEKKEQMQKTAGASPGVGESEHTGEVDGSAFARSLGQSSRGSSVLSTQ